MKHRENDFNLTLSSADWTVIIKLEKHDDDFSVSLNGIDWTVILNLIEDAGRNQQRQYEKSGQTRFANQFPPLAKKIREQLGW